MLRGSGIESHCVDEAEEREEDHEEDEHEDHSKHLVATVYYEEEDAHGVGDGGVDTGGTRFKCE